MNEARKAIENSISLEIKKDGLVQRQSGDWQLRFTVAAIDMHQVIVNAPMGQRFACVLVEINDDETPVDHKAIERGKWRDLGPAKQAGMRCHEPLFWTWLAEQGPGHSGPYDDEEAAKFVRNYCGVETRSDLSKPGFSEARIKWHKLDDAYQAWKVLEHA